MMPDPTETRIPPHDLDAEAAVISLIFCIDTAFAQVNQILRVDDFYSEAHACIYKAAVEVARKGIKVDIVTCGGWLRDNGTLDRAGGMAYLTTCVNAAPNVYNIKTYAKIVKDKSNVRKLLSECQRITAKAYGTHGDDSEFLVSSGASIREITRIADKSEISSNKDALRALFQKIERANALGSDITGLETGLHSLDVMTTGLHAKQMTIIGARPGTGKSLRLLQIANAIAGKGVGVALFSLEMSKPELLQRQISQLSRVDATSLETGKLSAEEWRRVTKVVGELANLPIFIDDKSDLTISQIRERSLGLMESAYTKKTPIGVILIDFLQRVRIPREDAKKNMADVIGDIARGLKELSKEASIAVVAAAALKRIPEGRPGRAPTMDDLRLSGDIESEADDIQLLHRPAMYSASADKSLMEIHRPKARHGVAGQIKVLFEPQYLSLQDWPSAP